MAKEPFDSIEDCLAEIRAGRFVVIVDDARRENEGDLIVAAEKITPEQVNFMLKNARGVLCVPMPISRCRELALDRQVEDNTSVLGTPFTITVDKLEGCSTGVSIADRAATIRALADPKSRPETFGRPGHINPLYAQDKGVLQRAGHTEASVDLCRLAGLEPVEVPVRGGTDGATLSWNGLPCPNLGTGGFNFHGVCECTTVERMDRCTEILLNIISLYAE